MNLVKCVFTYSTVFCFNSYPRIDLRNHVPGGWTRCRITICRHFVRLPFYPKKCGDFSSQFSNSLTDEMAIEWNVLLPCLSNDKQSRFVELAKWNFCFHCIPMQVNHPLVTCIVCTWIRSEVRFYLTIKVCIHWNFYAKVMDPSSERR